MEALPDRSYKVLYGKYYGTPTDLWGFRAPRGRGTPGGIARDFVRANVGTLKLQGIERRLSLRRVVQSLGAQHVILQQSHAGLRIQRAYLTVHLDRERRVYLVKNRTMPRERLPERARFRLNRAAAHRRALRELGMHARESSLLDVERVWFPEKESLRTAFRLRIHRERPRAEWLVYVDGLNGRVLSKYDNLAQAAPAALVFDPNPVAAVRDWRKLVKDERAVSPPDRAYVRVTLKDLDAPDRLDGSRVTTCETPHRYKSAEGDFCMTSRRPGFEEVMAYFHIDRAIRYLEALGYRGPRALFRAPLVVNARGTRQDNSWYSPGLRRLTFGTGGVDDAEDGETILHEFGHAVQDAICPDFGQSPQAAAMGEGFGDYFAGSFFADKKPRALRAAVMSWDGLLDGEDPPCVRRLDEELTFESFDPALDEHENGPIWSATLWDVWNAVGRDVADRIIVESHFQLDGFTTFARGARAILDADRHLFRGTHVKELKALFTARGIGPLS
jgi:hypothetical protein